MEAVAATPPPTVSSPTHGTKVPSRQCTSTTLHADGRAPIAQVDVYVDDFLLMAQTASQRRQVLRATLSSIDKVLRPLTPDDPPHRKEPASIKKMRQGDAHWATDKRILGWDINTSAMTLSLPPHRLTRLHAILDWISPPRRRLPVKQWHQLLGELRSMAPALPGARGLFSLLQDALRHADQRRIRITPHLHALAADFRRLVDDLARRPTRLQELVPTYPSDIGASDACQHGMGGVWFDNLDPHAAPILWRHRFPPHVASALITAANPTGHLSISDLELAGIIAHRAIVAQARDVAERTIWVNADNRAAVSWTTKGSSTSAAARAHLLRFAALHQRAHRYVVRTHYLPGPVNVMADDASRRWDLDDAALLTFFNTRYPQVQSWQMQTLTPATSASLIGSLSKPRSRAASPPNGMPPPIPLGPSGRPSVPA